MRVLSRDHDVVDSERAQPGIEAGAFERAVDALGRDELPLAGLGTERVDHLRARGSGHRVLTPDPELGVAGLVCVVGEHDDPAFRARMGEQPADRLHDRLRTRVRERAVDEVHEHVDDDQSCHEKPSAGLSRC